MENKKEIPNREKWIYEFHDGKEPVVELLKRAIAELAAGGKTVLIILGKKEYKAALKEINTLLDKSERTAEEGERLAKLRAAVVAFEQKKYPAKYVKPARLLKYLLEVNDLKIKKLAEQAGVNKKRLKTVLKNDGIFTQEEAEKIGRRFCLNPEAFLPRPKKQTKTTEESQ